MEGIFKMDMNYCQACGMPMAGNAELHGTNADGSKNSEYCKYCFVDGAVTFSGTMDEMIEIWIPHMLQSIPGMKETEARNMMRTVLPKLKYWQGK